MFFLLFSLVFLNAEHGSVSNDIITGSSVSRVIVYPSGARIERRAVVQLATGNNEITITPLSGNVDLESINVTAEGNLTVLSVSNSVNFLQNRASTGESERLAERKKDLEFRIDFQKNLVYVLDEEEAALKENRRVEGNSQLTGILYLRDVMDFYRQRLTEISTKRLEIRREIAKLEDDLNRINNQLSTLQRGGQQPVTEVKILIHAPVASAGSIKLSYFTSDAQWLPVYDVRVQDVENPLRLQYKAGISQRTGESWDQVGISLSSSAPLQGQLSPELNPWRIDYSRVQFKEAISSAQDTRRLIRDGSEMRISGIVVDATTNEPLPGANILYSGTNLGTTSNAQGFFSLHVPSNTTEVSVSYIGYESQTVPVRSNMLTIAMNPGDFSLEEVVVAGVSVRGTRAERGNFAPPVLLDTPLSFNFEVPAPYTISGDGDEQQVIIAEYDLEAQYSYLAIPKIQEKAWLQARISDWERLNLLNGRANLFLGNTYLGSTRINPAALTDTLSLNLGIDESIIIKRTKADQFSSRGFLGGRETQTLTWDIEIRNTKPFPVSLRLTDQIPVSNRREISVDLTESGGAVLNVETGSLLWLLDLSANQTRTLRFSYQVRYPRDVRIELE